MCVINFSCTSRCGVFRILQQFRKKAPKFHMKLAKHEQWHCFLEGASHVLCKARTLILLLQCSPERQKWGTQTFCLEKGSCCLIEIAWKKIITLLQIPLSSQSQVDNKKGNLLSFVSRSCCIFSKSFHAVFCQQISINLALAPVDQKTVRMQSNHTAGSYSQLINSDLFIFNE